MQVQAATAGYSAVRPQVVKPGPAPVADRFCGAPLRLLSNGAELSFPADGSVFLMGRESVSGDTTVSRKHAWGCYREGQLYLRDAGSRNGTTVNGQPVPGDKWVPVPANAAVQLGDTRLHLGITLDQLAEESRHAAVDPKPVLETSVAEASAEMARTPGVVQLPRGVPTLVITDIHARRDYLLKALEKVTPSGEKVFDLLRQGRLNVVCLGDGMHAEGRARQRWQAIETDALGHGGLSPQGLGLLDQEMTEGLGTMKMVMDLKTSFPEHFHFIRGNHEEVKGHFCKYARVLGESDLVHTWMNQRLGPDFVDRYAAFEQSMPLVAVGQGFVASHAAPGKVLSRESIDGRTDDARVALTWTENSVRDSSGHYTYENPNQLAVLDADLEQLGARGAAWFCGHRPVRSDEHDGRYRSQFGGRLVQLNNPDSEVVAYIGADGRVDPEKQVSWL